MVNLPTTEWGDPAAEQHALLIHGINGAGAGWWRIGEALAQAGWHAVAVDLRGHGTAPRATTYAIADYVADLPGANWDLVAGHSLGGAIGVAAAGRPGFTRRLLLLDPVLRIPAGAKAEVRAEQVAELTASMADLSAERPRWHPRDIRLKFEASRQADREMVDRTFDENDPWELIDEASRLEVDTLILGADPAVFTFFPSEQADAVVAANKRVTYRVVAGAGHSPHRDRPEESIALITEWLATSGDAPRP